ncbi:MAG: GH92 family glycosyl hydrolase [Bacteroidales bacterium]|nr:GH92 family glycosyl hydrolase [Bacteroidales bacterium]
MKRNIYLVLSLIYLSSTLLLFSCNKEIKQSNNPIEYVNPFVGTGGHGHTYPGASAPFGMVQLSPDSRLTGWDGCSAYHYSDSVVYGFSHTHLSGTGISDYGDILFMPTTSDYKFSSGEVDYGYESEFSHENERAEPGFYEVLLERYQVKVELTATERTGMHRYSFPQGEEAHVILDLKHRDIVLESFVKLNGNKEVVGMRRSRAWAQNQYVYFVAQFSKPFQSAHIITNDTLKEGITDASGKNLKTIFSFGSVDELVMKVGISAVSVEGARKNLEAENPNWDFDKVKTASQEKWNNELAKIEIEGGTQSQKEVFYTSLYHAYLNPNLFMDVDGKYRGTDMKIHQSKGFDYFTVFSLWDTFRATHPLFTLTQQKRTADFIKTFIQQYEDGGQLPVWELAGNYTGCMIGYHSIPVIVDAYFKGIRDYDIKKVYRAMKHSADQSHLGLDAYKKNGFIAINDEPDCVSKTLEYAYDDWCIAQMAKDLGEEDDYRRYIIRAQSYKNIYDAETGFMRPKKDNIWKAPFDPREVDFNFTEANSWQYSFFVPQDVNGLIELHGGDEGFVAKLDSLFTASTETLGRHQSDITGLIGQYAHGNEPSHHMAYLYNYAGQAWKSQEVLHRIMDELYTTQPDGLSGNEDCGQMSAWYVLSAMGFYSVTPGSVDYIFGTPLFEKVTLNLENRNQFVVKAKEVSATNFYIQKAWLNGNEYDKSYITQNDIMNGGELIFKMGPKPNKEWASMEASRPKSTITDNLIQSVPFVIAKSKTFSDSLKIELGSPNPDAKVFYTIDGNEPDESAIEYTGAFYIYESNTVRLISFMDDLPASKIVESSFVKIDQRFKLKLISKYNNQYTAGGKNGLIDFIHGGSDFRDGTWQGYEAQDFIAILDLGKSQKIKTISTAYLQSIRSWIWMPKQVEYFVSDDGQNFRSVGVLKNTLPDDEYQTISRLFTLNLSAVYGRYVKIVAQNYGTIPNWHLGAGGQAWIFVDEIEVE